MSPHRDVEVARASQGVVVAREQAAVRQHVAGDDRRLAGAAGRFDAGDADAHQLLVAVDLEVDGDADRTVVQVLGGIRQSLQVGAVVDGQVAGLQGCGHVSSLSTMPI